MENTIHLELGNYYHIYNRGTNKGNIFFEERNYEYFLKLYIQYIFPITNTYAYCLMKNHFHLLVRIKPIDELADPQLDNPTQQFSNFFNSYAKSINSTYHRTGGLFEHRFGRILVDSESYFTYLITYIHRNPQKHGFVKDFRTYPHSSYHAIKLNKNSRLETSKVMNWFGDLDSFNYIHQFEVDESRISHLLGDDFI
jgi:REP element-mobilizing transposase RayT